MHEIARALYGIFDSVIISFMVLIKNQSEMEELGQNIGLLLKGGEAIELIGDVGAGKTTFVRGLARGMGVNEVIASPSFTINRLYDADKNMKLAHYDFYRLNDPGIMEVELKEAIADEKTVVVVEWSASVQHVLPRERLTIEFHTPTETVRNVKAKSTDVYRGIFKGLLA